MYAIIPVDCISPGSPTDKAVTNPKPNSLFKTRFSGRELGKKTKSWFVWRISVEFALGQFGISC